MLPRDHSLAGVGPGVLETSSRGYTRGEFVSDGDITLPHNPSPDAIAPRSNWPVHLEVHPEHLVMLHPDHSDDGGQWVEPLDDADDGLEMAPTAVQHRSPDSRSPSSSRAWPERDEAHDSQRRGFAFPRAPGATAAAALVPPHHVGSTMRPPGPVYRDESRPNSLSDGMMSRPFPPAPRLPSSLPPPHPPSEVLYEPPLHLPARAEPSYSHAPLALVPKPAWLARAPEVALDKSASIPPYAFDAPPGSRVVRVKTLWLGAGGLVVVTACIAAFVSTLMWSLHDRWSAEDARLAAASSTIQRPEPRREPPTAEEPRTAEPQPTSVPIEELPLLNGSRVAPVTIAEEPSSPSSAEDDTDAEEAANNRAASGRGARSSAGSRRMAVASRSAPSAARTQRSGSALDQAVAEAAGATSADAEPAGPAEPGAPDRGAIASAVARAAAAAQSCGEGPEHGKVMVRFNPSGSAGSIQLIKPFSNRDTNACVLRAMSRARVPAFVGDPVSVSKTLRW